MKSLLKKTKYWLLLIIIVSSLLSNFSHANTYINNSMEIEVSPVRRSYDYGDNVGIDINITNKNRYAKLHYRILEVYSGGGFIPLNLDETEHIIEPFGTNELEVSLRDFFYKEAEDRTIDTHITFNNDASSGISKTDNASSGISIDNDASSGISKSDNASSGISKNNNYQSPNNYQVANSRISKNNNASSGINKTDNADSGISKNNSATSGINIDSDARSGISKNNNYQNPNNSQVADSGISKNNNATSGIEKDNDVKSGISKSNDYNSPNNVDKAGSGISKNNNYYHRKHTYTIGGHAYELTEAEYDEYTRYRNEKVVGEKLGTTPFEKSEQEKLEQVKSQINATLLIIIIVLIIAIALILFIWFIIKSKSKGGYPNLSKFTFFSILLITTLFINILFNVTNKENVYAADIYQENVQYNKTITTQVNYANFTCTFRVTVEYYFVNTIVPITDLELDTDSDTLPDYLEVLYLTDLNNEDTDGDGLLDGVEIYRTYTDPLRVDTDNNGVNDGDEDYDKDKLTNIEEKNHGTDYDNTDTDFDSLSDYDEINEVKTKDGLRTYQTDPLSDDTDGDGLRDDTELKLNLNPTNPSDAHTKVNQEISTSSVLPKSLTIESPTPISFKGELVGNIDENVRVRKSFNSYYDQIEGVVGIPIIVETIYGYNDGLKIIFDLTKYQNIANRIQLCRVQEGKIVFVEHTYVSDNVLYGDCYSGEYVLIDSKKYMQDMNLFIK